MEIENIETLNTRNIEKMQTSKIETSKIERSSAPLWMGDGARPSGGGSCPSLGPQGEGLRQPGLFRVKAPPAGVVDSEGQRYLECMGQITVRASAPAQVV